MFDFSLFRLTGFAALWLMVGPLSAMAPKIYSDAELAKFPVIVVAQWEKVAFRSHTQESKNDAGEAVVEKWEHYTKLKVLRTIKGDKISPGEHDLKVDWGIAWNKEGKGLETGTSTQIPGDVDDITVPRIWFLQKDRSWDSTDDTEYLSIGNFRGVQDLAFEQFFVAAGSESQGEKVAELLDSEDPKVVERALRFLCGARDPWPVGPAKDEPEWFYDLQEEGTVYPDSAEKVREAAGRTTYKKLEPLFMAAYARLAKKLDGAFLQSFLQSENVDSRIVATCLLIRKKQFSGLEKIEMRKAEAHMVLRMITEIEKQKGLKLVPLLIAQLENGENCGSIGSNYLIPALKAKKALRELTGCVFPFDVEALSKAWEVAKFENRVKRFEIISKLAPAVEMPFKAEVIGTPAEARLRVTNVSKIPTMLAAQPSGLSQSAPGISSGGFPGSASGPKYQMVAAEGFLDFPIKIAAKVLLAPAEQRSISIEFLDNGGESGPRAWIGVVSASFGKGWSEERLEETVEERWPNGNLKMIGKTINGNRVGDWEFFSEGGDRVKKVGYTGGGTAICNPEHPNNKGAGIWTGQKSWIFQWRNDDVQPRTSK